MSKGDTTIRIDMEVAGASSAKMTAKDVYQSIESASRKATTTEEAEMKKRANAAKSLAKQKEKYLKQNQAQEYRDWLKNEQKKIESVGLLQAQRSRYVIANAHAEEQEKRRLARETAAETKRIARGHERDSKRRMREEARDAKMLAGQKGMVGGLVGRGLWAGAMGIAGYAGVAGVSNAISGTIEASKETEKKQAEFERDITPVVSLGDNIDKMNQIRTETIGIGATMGKSNQEVAAFFESIDSLANSVTPEVLADIKKESLELSELKGGNLQDNMRLIAKTNEIYGESFDTVNQIQNKMLRIQEDSDTSMAEFASRMPDVLAAGKALGLTVDEIGAAVISSTLAGGSAEKAFTGTRTAFVAMERAEEKGIHLSGTLAEKLEQVSIAAQQGKIDLLDIFQGEGITAGASIVDKFDVVADNVKMLSELDPAEDVVADKLKAKYADPKYAKARIYDLDQALIENGPNLAVTSGKETTLSRFNERWRLGQHAGNQRGWGETFGGTWVTGLMAAMGNDTLLEEGEQIRLAHTPEGSPIRNEILKKQFEAQKARDIAELDDMRKNDPRQILGASRPNLEDMPEYKAIQARQFAPEQANTEQPSLEKSIDAASKIDESNKILREIADKMGSGGGTKTSSNNTNNGETL